MTLRQRKFLPHDIPSWVDGGAVYFLTLCCKKRGLNQLCRRDAAEVIFEAASFRQRMHRWHVHLMLLMPDHLHALLSFPLPEDMRKVVAGFKEIVAKRFSVEWQRDFFDHRLRSGESFDEKAQYIRMNPVRSGLVANLEAWPWIWPPDIGADTTCGGPSGPALPAT